MLGIKLRSSAEQYTQAGETSQWLRTSATCPETIPNTNMATQPFVNPVPKSLISPSNLKGIPGMHMVHKHVGKTPMHIT